MELPGRWPWRLSWPVPGRASSLRLGWAVFGDRGSGGLGLAQAVPAGAVGTVLLPSVPSTRKVTGFDCETLLVLRASSTACSWSIMTAIRPTPTLLSVRPLGSRFGRLRVWMICWS